MPSRSRDSSDSEEEHRGLNKRQRVERSHVEQEEEEEEEEGSSEYESDDADNEYESIKMTQKQYDDYLDTIDSGYKNLTSNLQTHRSAVARDGDIISVQSNLDKANSLYGNSLKISDSHYKNEITNLDSKLMREIGEQLSLGVSNMNFGVMEKGLDVQSFLVSFAKYGKQDLRVDSGFGDEDDEDGLFYQGESNDIRELNDFQESFNWNKLNALYMKHSSKIPTIDFMLGPLDVEFKKRRVTRLERDYEKTGPAAKPNQVGVDEIMNQQEKDTYRSSIQCFKVLKNKNNDSPINLFEFFINPDSFSQSIENLFYTSFLINHNKLLLYKDENGIPIIKIHENLNEPIPSYIASAKKSENKSHLIFKLEYDTWLKLIDTYGIKELYLGHRKSSKAGGS